MRRRLVFVPNLKFRPAANGKNKEEIVLSILIRNVTVLSMEKEKDGSLKPPFKADIAIEGSKIVSIGTADFEKKYDKIIEGCGLLAMPGLINTHGHVAMSLFRGYGDDMELMPWLMERVLPAEAKMTPADIALGGQLAIMEMIKSGTTTFADMYFMMDKVAEVVAASGMRASLCEGMTTPMIGQHDKLEDFPAFYEKWHNAASGRITIMLGPHAPYTCDKDYLKRVGELGRQYQAPIHIHLAETQTELEQINDMYGCRPVQLLEEAGIFDGNKVLAAHGIYINEQELRRLAQLDVSIAHNPRSNMKLASGLAPVAELLAHGINVAIGTDSACSNNNLDMFQELRTSALLAKVRELDPTVLPAAQVLEMATINGAKALALADVGMLLPGMEADIILLDLDQPHLYPPTDLISHMVYAACGSDVDSVIISGQLVMEKRQILTMDCEKIQAEAAQAAKRLCV